MPDENGRIPPVFFNASAWTRAFGPKPAECDVCGYPPGNCEGYDPDCPDNTIEITWTPDPSLDGAHFTPE